MELLHQLPVKPENVAFFSIHLKQRWPQINQKTKIQRHNKYEIVIHDKEIKSRTFDKLLPVNKDIKQSVKEQIKESIGQTINDKNYIMKIVDDCCLSVLDGVSSKKYYFEEIACYGIDGKREYLACYYHPQLDTLFIKE